MPTAPRATALCFIYFHQRDAASFEQAGQRALELNPSSFTIMSAVGFCAGMLGDWERGLALARRAEQLNPVLLTWASPLYYMHAYRSGDFETAWRVIRDVPADRLFWWTALRLAAVAQIVPAEEARGELRALEQLYPGFGRHAAEELSKWVPDDDLVQSLLEGFRKAGLEGV